MFKKTLIAATLIAAVSNTHAAIPVPSEEITLSPIGTHASGAFAAGAAEIVAYDAASRRVFVINANAKTVDLIDITDPANPLLADSIDVTADIPSAGGINSVAVHAGLVAIAVENIDKQANGWVAFYDSNGVYLNKVAAGALPDMVTFTPNGRYVLCANEGEPSADYSVDPEGSVTIIDLRLGAGNPKTRTADFRWFNRAVPKGVRIAGPGASTAQDLEPESIAVSTDSQWAWVTLQENNALALIYIPLGRVVKLMALGSKDHLLAGNGLDPSDKDGLDIANWPVRGLYMPDGAAAYQYDRRSFVVTANEGDAREYAFPAIQADCPTIPFYKWSKGVCTYLDEARVKDIQLDPVNFPDAAALKLDANLGRLKIVATEGNTDGDIEYEKLYSYGGRSLSIWNSLGMQVFDSGDMLEQYTGFIEPIHFNSTHDTKNSGDSRSDDKGPEPEGVAIGAIGTQTYAFVGLERIGGIAIFNITDPYHVQFVGYANNRNFAAAAINSPEAGDLGPEGLVFIPAADSPNGNDLLVVGNEVSGTTTVYEITINP